MWRSRQKPYVFDPPWGRQEGLWEDVASFCFWDQAGRMHDSVGVSLRRQKDGSGSADVTVLGALGAHRGPTLLSRGPHPGQRGATFGQAEDITRVALCPGCGPCEPASGPCGPRGSCWEREDRGGGPGWPPGQ